MKRILATGFAALLMVCLLASCAGRPPLNVFNPGSYTVRQQGHNGFFEIEVTFSQNAIKDIRVLRHFETPWLIDKAMYTDIPRAIIENQSLNVDIVTGATVTSLAMLAAVENAVIQAGGSPDNLRQARRTARPRNISKTADVVIVGGGGAGLAAAVEATRNGASVIIIETLGFVGGNTMVSGGIFNAPNPELQRRVRSTPGVEAMVTNALNQTPVNAEHARLQAAVRAEFEAHRGSGATHLFDSPNWFALQTWIEGDKVADLNLVKIMTHNALSALNWVIDQGYQIVDGIFQGGGAMYQRTHNSVAPQGTGFIRAFMQSLEKTGNAEILLSTTANELVKTGGRVTGVRAVGRHGNNYTINARKNVILATGGFAGNPEMVQKHNTSGKWPDLSRVNNSNLPSIRGDGILMAQAIGAAVRDMYHIQLLQTCHAVTGHNVVLAWPRGVGGYLFLNRDGNRFVAEDGRRDDVCLAIFQQPGRMAFLLQSGESIPDPDNTTCLARIPLAVHIEAGEILVADTLEEVSRMVGMDPVNAQRSVDAFNRAVAEGAERDEFGRRLLVQQFTRGPWYIIPRAPAVHHTMGGLVINENCQVLNQAGNVIPGLFAAGEVVGGIHGANRLGANALVDVVVFGRIAGQNASR